MILLYLCIGSAVCTGLPLFICFSENLLKTDNDKYLGYGSTFNPNNINESFHKIT